ncbi:phosphonate C-P lyase system protein PhnH [Rhodocyclaceae bacterium SMB388]
MATADTATLEAWHPSRQQKAFRTLMEAFSYPGRVCELTEAGDPARMLLLATLVDGACTLADAMAALSADDWRRLGARGATVEQAQFVLARGDAPLDDTPRLGTLECPEQGATVILQVADFDDGAKLTLDGPGVRATHTLRVAGVDPAWWQQRAEWNCQFPMGVDLILLAGHRIVALPRTTRIIFKETN